MSCWLDPMMWPTCAAVGAANAYIAVASIPDGIAHSFGDAATSAVTLLWTQVSNATTIDLTTGGIRGDLAITAAIAAVITIALFCIQVIGCAMRGSFAGLGRSARGLLIAFAGAAFAIGATQLLLTAVDALANGVVQAAVGQNIQQIGAELVAVASFGVLGWAGLLLMSLVLLLAVAFIWCALMIRKMLIVFAPIAFSGAIADITKGWVHRWIEFTVALIFSKLILVVIFLIGLSMLQGAGATGSTTNQVTNLAIGTLTPLLAGFAPWMAIKMVHFAGDAFHHVHAQAGAASAGAATVATAPAKAASFYGGAKGLVMGRTASRAGGTGGTYRPAALAGTGTPAPSVASSPARSAALAASASGPRGAAGSSGAGARNGSAGPGSTAGHGIPSGDSSASGGAGTVVATLPRPAAGGDEFAAEASFGDIPARPIGPAATHPARSGDDAAAPAPETAAPPPPSPPTRPTPRARPATKPPDPPSDQEPIT